MPCLGARGGTAEEAPGKRGSSDRFQDGVADVLRVCGI